MQNTENTQDLEKEQPLEKIIKGRKEKLERLESAGINPYPSTFESSHNAASVRGDFNSLSQGEKSETDVKTCGRLILRREMGKALFANLSDLSGTLQIYLRRDAVGEQQYEIFTKMVDIGDFAGKKFMAGEPMNPATNRLLGWSYRF